MHSSLNDHTTLKLNITFLKQTNKKFCNTKCIISPPPLKFNKINKLEM